MQTLDRVDLETLSNIDNYNIVKTISTEGGFGDVVLGEKDGEEYAIKILRLWEIHPDERKSVTSRFYREFEAGSIVSPYLVKSFECGSYKGNPYHAMEFVPHGSLRDVMEGKTVLGNPILLAVQILLGLQELHKNGVVHRDLKPENVLIANDQIPKLTDFGISGFMYSRETKTNWMGRVKEMFGTIAYAPPEQFDQYKAFTAMRPTIDIFSFGVMIYEYLTGHYPFGDIESAEDVILYKNRMKKKEYSPLSKYINVTDDRWIDIVDRCIDPEIKNRFQSIEELISIHFSSEEEQVSELLVKEHISVVHNINAQLGLMIMNGDEPKKTYHIEQLINGNNGLLTLGFFNSSFPNQNNIGIKELSTSYISSFHATLEKHADAGSPTRWLLRDGQWRQMQDEWGWHNSTNGIYINSQKLNAEGAFLNIGDIITLGDTTLKFDYY